MQLYWVSVIWFAPFYQEKYQFFFIRHENAVAISAILKLKNISFLSILPHLFLRRFFSNRRFETIILLYYIYVQLPFHWLSTSSQQLLIQSYKNFMNCAWDTRIFFLHFIRWLALLIGFLCCVQYLCFIYSRNEQYVIDFHAAWTEAERDFLFCFAMKPT